LSKNAFVKEIKYLATMAKMEENYEKEKLNVSRFDSGNGVRRRRL
jgi:hypothetical protein